MVFKKNNIATNVFMYCRQFSTEFQTIQNILRRNEFYIHEGLVQKKGPNLEPLLIKLFVSLNSSVNCGAS